MDNERHGRSGNGQWHGEERRHSAQEFKGQDRRKANGGAHDDEERMREEEELRLQDQLNRPETD